MSERPILFSAEMIRAIREDRMTRIALPPRVSGGQNMLSDMGRRRHQKTGSLSQRSGSWLLRWREDSIGPDGQTRREQRSQVIGKAKGIGAITKRQAQAIANETVLAKVNANVNTPASSVTVRSFAEGRFQSEHIDLLKPAGRDHYAYVLGNHVLPALGSYRLREITPMVLQTFFAAKRKAKYSTQTIMHMRNCISGLFRYARVCGLFVGQLPTEGIRLQKVEHQERSAVSAEEATKIIAALPGQYSVLAALLFTTGLRIGEAAGLKWKRVDFTTGQITVRETFSKGRWVSPKSDNSVRTIPVPARILAEIKALRDRGELIGPDDPVFVTTHGNPIGSHTTAAKILKPVVKALGLPWVCWHSFRHSNATFADEQGMSIAGRRKLLGHGSDRMALRYTHPEAERARAALEGIAAAVMPELRGGKPN